MSNEMPSGPAAHLIDNRPASAPVVAAPTSEAPSWVLLPVFDGKSFSDSWLETLNQQFGVEK